MENQQLGFAPTVSSISRYTAKQRTTTTVSITFVYSMWGFITLNAADFYYVCGFITFTDSIALVGVTSLIDIFMQKT